MRENGSSVRVGLSQCFSQDSSRLVFFFQLIVYNELFEEHMLKIRLSTLRRGSTFSQYGLGAIRLNYNTFYTQ